MIHLILDYGNKVLPPASLLRDVIYALQGVDTDTISFTNDRFEIRENFDVPNRLRDIVSYLGECGWLYRKLRNFLSNRPSGLVAQAFCCSIEKELDEYIKLLSVLDSQQLPQSAQDQRQLSLHRLLVWLHEPRQRLIVLGILVDIVNGDNKQPLCGGAICSALHKCSASGGPFVSGIVTHITEEVILFFLIFVFRLLSLFMK